MFIAIVSVFQRESRSVVAKVNTFNPPFFFAFRFLSIGLTASYFPFALNWLWYPAEASNFYRYTPQRKPSRDSRRTVWESLIKMNKEADDAGPTKIHDAQFQNHRSRWTGEQMLLVLKRFPVWESLIRMNGEIGDAGSSRDAQRTVWESLIEMNKGTDDAGCY